MEFKISGETGRKERTDLRMAKPQYKGTDRVQGKSYQPENMLSPGERNPAQGVQQPSKAIYRFFAGHICGTIPSVGSAHPIARLGCNA